MQQNEMQLLSLKILGFGGEKKRKQTGPASSYLSNAVLSEHKVRAHSDFTPLGLGRDPSDSHFTGDSRLAENWAIRQVRAGRVSCQALLP